MRRTRRYSSLPGFFGVMTQTDERLAKANVSTDFGVTSGPVA